MKTSFSRCALLALVISPLPALAGPPRGDPKAPVIAPTMEPWERPLFGAGFKTSDDYTDGNVFLTFPLFSTIGGNGTLGGDYLFIEPYFSVGENQEMASSIGLGWRHLFSSEPVTALGKQGRAGLMDEGLFIGARLFLDMLNTPHDNQFWQLGVGAEAGTRYFELRGNYYLPLSDEKLAERSVTERSFTSTRRTSGMSAAGDPYATGNTIAQDVVFSTFETRTTTTIWTVTEIFEEGMEGWDAEAAVLLPWVDQWMDVKLIGGYYSFDNQPFGPQSFGTGNVEGWKAGLEARPVPAVVLSAMWYEDKRLTGGDWTLGVQFQIPLDSTWKDAFRMRRRHLVERLAEPVRRQNEAVKIGNRAEQKSTQSLRRTTRVVSQGPQHIVLADDLVFVNNGPAVGNGIEAGSDVTGDGTAERPKSTVQQAANVAGANSNATGRVWNVYTQGGSASFGEADYFENVTASGSTNFIGSGSIVKGLGGRTFGSGEVPSVAGTISSTGFGFLGVTRYLLGGVSATNVARTLVESNTFIPASGAKGADLVTLTTTGSSSMSADVRGNTFLSPQGDAVQAESFGTSMMAVAASNNVIHDTGDDGLYFGAFGSSKLTAAAQGNQIFGTTRDGIGLYADDEAALAATVSGNIIDAPEFDGIYLNRAGSSTLSAALSSNTITNVATSGGNFGRGIHADFNGGAGMIDLAISGNSIDTTYGDAIGIHAYEGTTSTVRVLANFLKNSGSDGVFASAENSSTLNLVVNNNDFDGANDDYVNADGHDSSTINLTATGNVQHSASSSGFYLKGFDTSRQNFDISGNTISGNAYDGIFVEGYDSSTLRGTIVGNTITNNDINGVELASFGTGSFVDITAFNSNTILPGSGGNGSGIRLSESVGGAILQVNGTLSNSVDSFSSGRLSSSSSSPSGSIILNNTTVVLPADVP